MSQHRRPEHGPPATGGGNRYCVHRQGQRQGHQPPELELALQYVRAGDVFVVHSMDRLDHNLAGLRSIVNQLTSRGG